VANQAQCVYWVDTSKWVDTIQRRVCKLATWGVGVRLISLSVCVRTCAGSYWQSGEGC